METKNSPKTETETTIPTPSSPESKPTNDAPESVQTVPVEEAPAREPYIELEKDEKGMWHWCLFAGNGRPLCMNLTPYKRRNECTSALESTLAILKRKVKVVAAID